MALDFSPFAKAVSRLGEGLERYRLDTSDSQIRDGLIQRFEFTYDLAHKMLRRVLEQAAANPEAIDRLGFPDLIRLADEKGLIASGWPEWRTWREMRNITSHTYDETKALQVVEGIPKFLDEMRAVLKRLMPSSPA